MISYNDARTTGSKSSSANSLSSKNSVSSTSSTDSALSSSSSSAAVTPAPQPTQLEFLNTNRKTSSDAINSGTAGGGGGGKDVLKFMRFRPPSLVWESSEGGGGGGGRGGCRGTDSPEPCSHSAVSVASKTRGGSLEAAAAEAFSQLSNPPTPDELPNSNIIVDSFAAGPVTPTFFHF